MRFGEKIIPVIRTEPLGSGVRSVWYLPDGSSVHAIEDDPIPPGTYFLNPDDTGRKKHWVIEKELGSREAAPARGPLFPARVDVEMHRGNTMADTDACTCPGLRTKTLGVEDSRKALKHMRKVLGRDEEDPPVWVIEIKEAS